MQQELEIGIFTGGTSVRSRNIFTDIYRYPTGKHEIKAYTSNKPLQFQDGVHMLNFQSHDLKHDGTFSDRCEVITLSILSWLYHIA